MTIKIFRTFWRQLLFLIVGCLLVVPFIYFLFFIPSANFYFFGFIALVGLIFFIMALRSPFIEKIELNSVEIQCTRSYFFKTDRFSVSTADYRGIEPCRNSYHPEKNNETMWGRYDYFYELHLRHAVSKYDFMVCESPLSKGDAELKLKELSEKLGLKILPWFLR